MKKIKSSIMFVDSNFATVYIGKYDAFIGAVITDLNIKNHKYISHSQTCFYCIVFLCFLVLTGCASKAPINVTHTEYIPPITDAGQECVRTIENEHVLCKERIALETKVCQDKAYALAQSQYSQALIDYTFRLKEEKKNRAVQEHNRQMQEAKEQKRYDECILRNKKRAAMGEQAKQHWRMNGRKGPMPYISGDENCYNIPKPAYYNNQNNYGSYNPLVQNYSQNNYGTYIRKPLLKDFIQDAHCFSNKNECIEAYNHNYETCTGKVIQTTRCVSNCEQ